MVHGSPVGVATAAKTNTPSTMPRHQRAEPLGGEDADHVEHHQDDRQQEGEAEDQQQPHDERQVAVDLDEVADALGGEADQDLQAAGQQPVAEGHAGEEQRDRGGDEDEGPAALVAVQARGDERPQLVQPDRGREHHAGQQGDLELQGEGVGDAGEDEPDIVLAEAARRARRTGRWSSAKSSA